ncbi:hypothetical protein KUTeg_019891 [Tegillarca granosa]|uniref:guanylate cyclase n=1 Tax=Tegillarca granosa TaxID=220873 RepID=A0ABQ9EJC0_TEGGR|nr:hypothetical protein KUTeg_019891 [Tegillarca granosa]
MTADADIGKKTWLIPWTDIVSSYGRNDFQIVTIYTKTVENKLSKIDGTDGESAGGVQLFTQTGICRGNIVAIRKLNLPSIDLNHTVLLQFRQLQTCQHSNLARFIGACIEPHNNALLMEYCPRGSLQDIIENEDIDLDWTFRFSLLWDIVKFENAKFLITKSSLNVKV